MSINSQIKIREAVEEDLETVLLLHKELDGQDEHLLNLKQAKNIFAKFKQYPYYKIFLAETDNEIVGTFALLIMNNLAHGGALSGIIEDVVVGANQRGKGIGKVMMTFAINECRKLNCYKIALSSHSKRVDAHRFYESLGFAKHGYSFLMDLPKA